VLHLIACGSWILGNPLPNQFVGDTLDVVSLSVAPLIDGRIDDHEYDDPPIRFATAAGHVRMWIGRHGGFVYVAAALPDSTFYWGDDFVVSLDPDGSGGASPGTGDRQWYLRRVLDSSVVAVADQGRWYPPDHTPPMLGPIRHHADWDVASTSSASGWAIELRFRETTKPGAAVPHLAVRTYNDLPGGWWSWPEPAAAVPAQRVERSPHLWVPLRLR